MKKKALIVLANGFEEVEAIAPIDILKRCEVSVTLAGLGSEVIKAAHGVTFKTDVVFDKYTELPDAVILPGGTPGAENLASSVKVKDFIVKMNSGKKIVAAICASPAIVLAPTGILSGKKATCYPGMEKNFLPDVNFSEEKVIQDGNIITSRGPGTAHLFGFKIAETLIGKAKSEMVASHMLFT